MQAYFFFVEFELEAFDTRQHVTNFFRAAFRQQSHEFVAAQAHGKIRAANGALQSIGESLQQSIARGVAVLVVNLLQAIEIHQQNGERAAVALRAADFLRQALFAGAAIVKPGQLIECGELVNLRGQSFPLWPAN